MDDVRIQPFDKTLHERAGFDCGEPPLNDFLQRLVSQYETRKLGKTFVAVRSGESRVLGYYTVASSAVAFGHLPAGAAKKLPKHPIPVILLARLAVDKSCQGHGLGEALLADALERSLNLSKSLGVFAVEVLAIDDRAAAFYAKYGFVPLLDDMRHMFLPLSAIEDAVRSRDSTKRTD